MCHTCVSGVSLSSPRWKDRASGQQRLGTAQEGRHSLAQSILSLSWFCAILVYPCSGADHQAHLFQGLHKLLYWDGATQQRLQHFAVRNVLTHPLPLLTAGGLGRPGRGLGQKESVAFSENLFTGTVAKTLARKARLISWASHELVQSACLGSSHLPFSKNHVCISMLCSAT